MLGMGVSVGFVWLGLGFVWELLQLSESQTADKHQQRFALLDFRASGMSCLVSGKSLGSLIHA